MNLIKDTGSVLPEYSTPIMAAGKGFEGFAIKLFISLGELDPDKIKKNPKSIQFNWKILENHLPNKQRDKYIIPKLLAEYNICRNFIVHSDPYRENELQNLNDARRMLETICETIKKAYKIFRPKIKQNQTPIESNSTTPILKKQKNECTVIESKNPIIGTDESGKGDSRKQCRSS